MVSSVGVGSGLPHAARGSAASAAITAEAAIAIAVHRVELRQERGMGARLGAADVAVAIDIECGEIDPVGARRCRARLVGADDHLLAIGAVVGIIGGIMVYIKWNSGDRDISKEVMSWGGSCIFLVLVSVVIKAFFGI